MEMEGGGTVLLRGGAEMGSTVLVGMRLKETDFGVSERGERTKLNERDSSAVDEGSACRAWLGQLTFFHFLLSRWLLGGPLSSSGVV